MFFNYFEVLGCFGESIFSSWRMHVVIPSDEHIPSCKTELCRLPFVGATNNIRACDHVRLSERVSFSLSLSFFFRSR